MDILSNPAEAPRADPHAGCCGGWGLNTPGYPIRPQDCYRRRVTDSQKREPFLVTLEVLSLLSYRQIPQGKRYPL